MNPLFIHYPVVTMNTLHPPHCLCAYRTRLDQFRHHNRRVGGGGKEIRYAWSPSISQHPKQDRFNETTSLSLHAPHPAWVDSREYNYRDSRGALLPFGRRVYTSYIPTPTTLRSTPYTLARITHTQAMITRNNSYNV